MMTAQLIALIMDNTNPVLGFATALLFFQVYATATAEVVTFYLGIKSQSGMLKLGLSLIPSIFILAGGLFIALLFSSFVGGGTRPKAMDSILALARSPQFLLELLAVVLCFGVLVVLYCWVFRPRKLALLLTFGLEVVIVALWLVAAGGLFIEGFPISITATALFPYLIYGYYSIIYKALLTLYSVAVGIVFRDRAQRNTTAREYFAEGGNYEAAAIQFLNYRRKTTGIVFVLTCVFLFGLMVCILLKDQDLPLQLASLQHIQSSLSWLAPLALVLILILIVSLFFAFFPRLSPAFRKLEKHDLFPLFYDEVVAKNERLPPTGMLVTAHFTICQPLMIAWIKVNHPR